MENDQNVKSDIVRKFERFRSIAEANQQKYREAVAVIERLNDENNLSRDLEKNLRCQLAETQDRLLSLQKNQKNYFLLKAKNDQIEKASYLLEEKVSGLQKLINENREASKKLLTSSAIEVQLQKNVGRLNAKLKEKDGDLAFLKKEVKMMQNEKIRIISEYEDKLEKLQDDLENARKENREIKLYSEKTLQMYKRQISDYEKTIQDLKNSEKNHQKNKPPSILKDATKPAHQDKKVTWADSTVSSFSEDSFNKPESQSEEMNAELCQELSRVETAISVQHAESQMKNIKEKCARRNFLPKVKKNLPKFTNSKPPLDFMVSTSENSEVDDSAGRASGKKRRLFYDDGGGDFLNE